MASTLFFSTIYLVSGQPVGAIFFLKRNYSKQEAGLNTFIDAKLAVDTIVVDQQ